MRKYLFIGFVLLALLLASLTVGKTYKVRNIQNFFTSDSDTVLVTRMGFRSDSCFDIGENEIGISAQLWICSYGDNAKVRVIWFYGIERDIMLPETLIDTVISSNDTINKILSITKYKTYKWGSFVIEDSFNRASGDSIKIGLFSFEK